MKGVKKFNLPKVKETSKKFAEELEKSKRPFLLFKNEKKEGVNILFRREDGNMGWVEPS